MTSDTKLSPMMQQWDACKKKAGKALLLFRLGDFYEAFEEDALLLAKELDLVLTKRQETPMAGIPAHTCESYIDKLVGKGYRVAVAEQLEDPKSIKGLVKREIVRIITPGTVINSNLLSDKISNYLVSICLLQTTFGLALLDVTTADFRVLECEGEKEVIDELFRIKPKEIVLSEKAHKFLGSKIDALIHVKEEWHFDPEEAYRTLQLQCGVQSLDGFGLKGMTAAIKAAGALISYIKDELSLSLDHVKTIKLENLSAYLGIDRTTQKHLELTEPLHSKGKTLLSHLDETATPMGARLLKEWLVHPLLSIEEIEKRQNLVELFFSHTEQTKQLREKLKEVRDLERVIMRIETGYASPRDVAGLRLSLEPLPEVSCILETLRLEPLPDLRSVTTLIEKTVVDHPPLKISDGGVIRPRFCAELDDLRLLKTDSQAYLMRYQAELREKLQIKTLKVGFTNAFGYYIDVSRGQSEKMPETFQRRQTLVSSERFISPELKEFEHKILTAEGRIAALENELFQTLRKEVAAFAPLIRKAASRIAEIDTLASLGVVAKTFHYCKPKIDAGSKLEIEEGRHPVIEAALKGETFIPNTTLLDQDENRLLVITGPNMAGKSTYIRQVALITILAQIGSFVPAKKATLAITDKVFSRIGASDDLSRGQSTFMVEMAETANILNNATDRSLVILDEIGRGTSTYDGIAIAWAVADFLLTAPGKQAKTLFATHYWELTQLEDEIRGSVNYNVAVQETPGGIVFLHKIVRGGTDRSYGIHVAKLAGLPFTVIKKAEEMLAKLHKEAKEPLNLKKKDHQLELF